MKLLVFGRRPRLATYLSKYGHVEVAQVDVTDWTQLALYIPRAARFDSIINMASVKPSPFPAAPSPNLMSQMFRVNSVGAGNVALLARMADKPLIHMSTDEVFPGTKGPYLVADQCLPMTPFGTTKWTGELAVMALAERVWVLRVGWLYGLWYDDTVPYLAATRADIELDGLVSGTPSHASQVAWAIAHHVGSVQDGDCGPRGIGHIGYDTALTWFDLLGPRFRVKQNKSPRREMKLGLRPSHRWLAIDDGVETFLHELWSDSDRKVMPGLRRKGDAHPSHYLSIPWGQ